MRYPKLRELREVLRSLMSRAYTTHFPKKTHEPFERFRGSPYFYEDSCIGCTACAQVCPAKAIDVEDRLKDSFAKRKLTIHWDICIFCGQCQANCPTSKGIVLSREFDLATTEKRQDLKQSIEKELILCECCGEAIIPFDQYTWVANRLGPLVFSNASLLLFYLRSVGLAVKTRFNTKAKGVPLNRASRIKILCPSCRREAVLKS